MEETFKINWYDSETGNLGDNKSVAFK